jgi:hypothetical protein
MGAEIKGLELFLKPWYESLKDPRHSQQITLTRLLEGYKQTEYGQEHNADKITTIEEFKQSFPIVKIQDLKPYIEKVMQGDFKVLLPEPVIEWAMTRGTTGKSKIIPITKTDLEEKTACGPRGLLNYVHRKQKYNILAGYDLNLNFPSVVGSMKVGGKEITYGYSSGIYAKYNAERARLNIVPEQKDIDALGGGTTPKDWDKRFELAYKQAKDKNLTMCIGVTQTMLSFGSYLKKHFRVYPKNIWNIDMLACMSIAGIHTKFKPALKGLYGDISIVEMYGATEGVYAQQIDNKPFVVPNYDIYLFEVKTRRGVKLLCDMRPGEYGSIIISSCLFPRYEIGDLIKCTDRNYYTVIGRDRPLTVLQHFISRVLDFDFRA